MGTRVQLEALAANMYVSLGRRMLWRQWSPSLDRDLTIMTAPLLKNGRDCDVRGSKPRLIVRLLVVT